MKKCTWLRIPLVFSMVFFLLACGVSFSGEDGDEDELRLQLTVQALQMTQAADSARVAQAPPAAPATSGEQPSSLSQESSGTSSQQADASGTPCNASKYVSETIPDGTNFNAGETFAKTWTLRNIGSCKWTENYVFEFEEGTRMGGESGIKVNTVIEPNETITFKVNLKAPATNGTYTGVWRLKAADGEKLGKYWVVINVGGGAPAPAAFAVTSVKLTLVSGVDAKVVAAITASAPGTVTYMWKDNGGVEKNGTVVFDSAGTKSVETPVIEGTGGWIKIYIDNPNHQWFGPIDVP